MPVAAKMIDLYEKQAVIAGLFMIAAIFLSFSWPDEKLQKPTFPGRDPYGVRRHFFVNQHSGKRSIFDALELSFPQALKNTFGIDAAALGPLVKGSTVRPQLLHGYNFLNSKSQAWLTKDGEKGWKWNLVYFSAMFNLNVCYFINPESQDSNVFEGKGWACTFPPSPSSSPHCLVFVHSDGLFWGLLEDDPFLPLPSKSINGPNQIRRLEWWASVSARGQGVNGGYAKGSLANFLKQQTIPLVLNNSIFEEWPSRKAWSIKHWNDTYGDEHIKGVYRLKGDTKFGPYYDEQRPYHTLTAVQGSNKYEQNVEMTVSQLMDHLNNSGDVYHYLSKELHLLDDDLTGIMGDFYPWLEELVMLNPKKSSINIWVGQSGVLTPCHYDGYHNVYVQIHGYKMFYLSSPKGASKETLKPFPYLHPSHAQCQFGDEIFSLRFRESVTVVLLKPGDVLYIPPLWFHAVVAISPSFSVNSWTEALDVARVEEMFKESVPSIVSMHPKKSMEHVVQTILLVYTIIQRIFGNHGDAVIQFLSRLGDRRYAKLVAEGRLPYAPNYPWEPTATRKTMPFSQNSRQSLCFDLMKPSILYRKYTKVRTESLQYIRRIDYLAKQISEQTREVWMGNYVEYMIAISVGLSSTPRFVLHELQKCAALLEQFPNE